MKSGRPFFLVLAAAVFLGSSAFAAPSPTNDVIAVIEMDSVPLPDALRQIARKAHLNMLLDPGLSASPYDRTMVSFRWQNVTAKEALTALLENHGLVLDLSVLSSSADRASAR